MADVTLRELERDVAAGNAPAEQLWATQCRAYGHEWSNLVGFPRNWLYVHLCKRCLATRGKKLSQLKLPELFTVTDHKNRAHVVSSVDNASKFRGICGMKLGSKFKFWSPEMIEQIKGYLENCFAAPTCEQCLRLLKRDDFSLSHKDYAKSHVAQVYKALFRPMAFATL